MYIHTHILYEITRNGSLACMLQGLNTMYASSCQSRQSLVCPVMLSSQTQFRASYVRKRSRLNSCSLQNAHGHCEPSTPAFAWVFFRMFSAPKIVHACLTAFSSLVCVSNQPKGHLELSWNIYSQYDWLHAQFLKNPEMLFLDYRILRSILFLATLQGCYKTGFPFARPSVNVTTIKNIVCWVYKQVPSITIWGWRLSTTATKEYEAVRKRARSCVGSLVSAANKRNISVFNTKHNLRLSSAFRFVGWIWMDSSCQFLRRLMFVACLISHEELFCFTARVFLLKSKSSDVRSRIILSLFTRL